MGTAKAEQRARVLVLGAGAAGMAAAWRLHRAGDDVLLLDKASRSGGVIGSRAVAGHLFECGPSTVLSNAEHLGALIDELGLRDQVVRSRPEAKRRYIWRHGALHPAPLGPGALLTSRLLSWSGKLRALWEPMVRAPSVPGDETLRTFLTRRLGREVVDALVDPFVTGVFAGDTDQLGSDAFAKLADLERDHGSLIKGMLAKRKKGKTGPGAAQLIGFTEGMAALPRALAERLASRLLTGVEIAALRRAGDGWRLEATDGARFSCERLILAVPAWAAAALLEAHCPEVARILGAIPHPHVAAVGLGYTRRQVGHPLDGFGVLCASDSPLPDGAGPILGALFPSSVFPGRAPEGAVTLSVMLGGTRDPDAAALDDRALVRRACHAASALLGADGEPTAVSVARHPRSIPQYTPGHRHRLEEVRAAVGELPGLWLAGNYLDGPGLDPTVGTGFRAAQAVA